MLIVPTLMPDELHLGYLGRMMHLNSIRAYDIPEALSKIKKRGNLSFDLWGTGTTLNLLTNVTQKSETELVRDHTLIPIFTLGWIKAWHKQLSLGMRVTAMQLVRDELCFCESCAAEDLIKHGFSYWRREHQLPGNGWCRTHTRMLRIINKKNAYFKSPSHFGLGADNEKKSKPDEASSPLIDRFLFLQKLILKAERGPSRVILWNFLKQMAGHMSSNSSSNDSRHLGQEMINAYGKDWLQALSPSFTNKTRDWLQWLGESNPFCQAGIPEDLMLLLMSAFLFDNVQHISMLLTEATNKKEIFAFNPSRKIKYESDLVNSLIRSNDDSGLDFVVRKLKEPKNTRIHARVLVSPKQMSLAL